MRTDQSDRTNNQYFERPVGAWCFTAHIFDGLARALRASVSFFLLFLLLFSFCSVSSPHASPAVVSVVLLLLAALYAQGTVYTVTTQNWEARIESMLLPGDEVVFPGTAAAPIEYTVTYTVRVPSRWCGGEASHTVQQMRAQIASATRPASPSL